METTVIIGFKELFPEDEVPETIESVVRAISRETLLFELAGLNYQLRPKIKVKSDTTYETQIQLFHHYSSTPMIYTHYRSTMDKMNFKHRNNELYSQSLFFNRQACVYGIELLLNSEFEFPEEQTLMSEGNNWENYLKFLSLLNYKISHIEPNEANPNFEELNAIMLPLNDIAIETEIFYEPIRGFRLLEYLVNKTEYGPLIEKFIYERYACSPQGYIRQIVSLYLSKKGDVPELEFTFLAAKKDKFLEGLTHYVPNNNLIDLLSIKSGPISKCSFKANCYVILDLVLLLEKSYTSLINDLWFNALKDKLVGDKQPKIRNYKAKVGAFFETYVEDTIRYAFSKTRHVKLFAFDELKILGKKKNEELADVYIRRDNKITVYQVKSSTLNSLQRTKAELSELYKNDRRKFYDTHGMRQIIQSIVDLDKVEVIDKGYKPNSRKDIYPILLVSDKIFQTPLMCNQFNEEFKVRMEESADTIPAKFKVHHLALVHISDFELLSNDIFNDHKVYWKIFKHFSSNEGLIPPFYSTANHFIRRPPLERLMQDYSKILA